MTEQIYFADTAVKITNTEATFGQRSYAISDITSVRYNVDPASKPRAWNVLTYMSLGANLLSFVPLITKFVLDLWEPSNSPLKYILFASWAVLLIASVLLTAARESFVRVRYLVTISGSFGKADVVVARNEKYAQGATKALNRALKDGSKTLHISSPRIT
jgi:hypothetical protein